MVKEEVKKIIQKALEKMGAEASEALVEVPKEKTHGDYSSNVALALSKKLGKNPIEVAQEIVAKIGEQKNIEKIEVAGPGFINFYLSREFFVGELKKINKNFGKNVSLKNKKIIIEYTDPNILKEFHIGHLMSNAIGESISRLIEFGGAKVKRTTWQSDVGLGIAKAVYGKMRNSLYSWQDAYVFGTKSYEESEANKKEIVMLNKKIFERSDKAVNKLYDEGKKWSLKYFDAIYKKLGTHFDYLIIESEAVDLAKKIVQEGLKNGVFQTGENGAIIFKGEKFGLHTRVFIN